MSAAVAWSAPLSAVAVGQAFETDARTISEEDVDAFAALTGDHHPLHVDDDWAAAGPFGRRIAHGMLVLSCAVGLVPLDPDRVLALRRMGDVVFKRPVFLGEAIRVRGSVTAVTPVGEEAGLVACSWSVLNQDDALTCRARVEILWRAGA